MNQADQDLIRAGVERRLAAVESLIPRRPMWRPAGDLGLRPALVRVVGGPALRGQPGYRRIGVIMTVGAVLIVMLALGFAGGGGRPGPIPSEPTPSPTATATAEPTEPGWLRPAVDPRLAIPVRPKTAWTVVEDGAPYLNLVYLLEDVGSGGYNVGLSVFEPHGVYDPIDETKRLPLPADLIEWIRDHPDLESGEPAQLTVAGLPATAIDVTVTYRADGPKGQTAQFIDIGPGSWNLEFPSKKRIVLVELADRPILIVFEQPPGVLRRGHRPIRRPAPFDPVQGPWLVALIVGPTPRTLLVSHLNGGTSMSRFAVLPVALMLLLTALAACSSLGAAPNAVPSVTLGSAPSLSTSPSVAGSPELTACNAPRSPQSAPTGAAISVAIALGCEAGAVAVGGGSVWVVPHLDRVALRIDPTTNSVIDHIRLGDRGPGAEIDATDDMVWASVSSPSYDPERLVRIDPATGSVIAWVDAAGAFPVIGAGFVWATGQGEVYRIDPATNSVAAVIEATYCWMTTLDDRAFCVGPTVALSIDPATDAVTPVPGALKLGWPVIAVDGLIWVIDGDALRAFDPETGQVDADIKAPEGVTGWSLDGVVLDGALWATASSTNGPPDRLVRIDRQNMAIDCVVPTPTSEAGMVAGFGSIWLPVLRQPWLLRVEPTC